MTFPFSAQDSVALVMAGFVFAVILDAAGVWDRVCLWFELRRRWK